MYIIGFNCPVRAILRLAAFGFSFAVVGVFLAIFSTRLPEAWLPLGLGVFVGLLFHFEPWMTKRGLATPLTVATGSGALAGWFASSRSTGKSVDLAYFPAQAFALFAAIALSIGIVVLLSQPAKQRRPGWWLLFPVLMVWVVSVGSSSAGGSGSMHRWVTTYLHLSQADAETLVHWVRKTIHFTWYGLLGLTARNAAASAGEKPLVAARFSLLLTALVASFDELRQASQPGRTSSAYDVLLDLAGAAVFVTAVSLLRRSSPKPAASSKPKPP